MTIMRKVKEWAVDITVSLVITVVLWGIVNFLGVEKTLRITVEILKHMNDE